MLVVFWLCGPALDSGIAPAQGRGSLSARATALEQFRELKFGMFIHWGLYAIPGRGEWEMHSFKVPVEVYEKYRSVFNPLSFDAEQIVRTAMKAGMRYLTFTTKHHDGFCMYDSALTDYKITRTPFGRDVTRELVEACRRNHLKIFFYYSLLDWHHSDYTSDGLEPKWDSSWPILNRPQNYPHGDWSRYLAYYQGQVKELCTRYGKIDGFWFDGGWNKTDRAVWKLEETMQMIRDLQPHALINTHEEAGFSPDEADFETPEHALTNEWLKTPKLLEVAATINDHYGYSESDTNFKSSTHLIRFLVDTVSKGANLLLNVGPTKDGTIQPECVERLEAIGNWLQANGESVYGTQMTKTLQDVTVVDKDSVRITSKGKRRFIHVFEGTSKDLLLEDVQAKIKSIRLLRSGREVAFSRRGKEVKVSMPQGTLDPTDTVLIAEVR